MTLRPFAVPAELRLLAQDETIPDETAQLVLALTSGAVRTFCRWPVSATVTTEEVPATCRGLGYRSFIWLKTLYLRAVDSVTGPDAVALTAVRDYTFSRMGRIELLSTRGLQGDYTVVYQHGYHDDTPEIATVRGVVLSAAARLLDNPTSLRSWTTGLESASTGQGTDVNSALLASGEKLELEQFRLP